MSTVRFLGYYNPLLKRDQSKIVINNSTCDTCLFIMNSFTMVAHSFPVPCYLPAIFHYFFFLKNKTKQSKAKQQQNKANPPPHLKNNKLREKVFLTYLYTCQIVNMGHYGPLSKGHVMEPS